MSGPTGVILAHLGTPEAPTVSAVRRYLAEFLSDPRVVEMPRLLWWPVLYGIILTTRPKRSAAAYQRVWGEEGSPLMVMACRQQRLLQQALDPKQWQVAIAMRYGTPAIATVIDHLWQQGCRRLVVLPMYPQYSATTTASVHDALIDALAGRRNLPGYHFIRDYHDHPSYISALAASVRQHWQRHGRGEHLLVSFHGIPQRYVDAGDPYQQECQRTTEMLVQALSLNQGEWSQSYQSRLGREPWLMPYTNHTLETLAHHGVKTVDVICPGFSTDCLETLDEIMVENAVLFTKSGGTALRYIPALNDAPSHISLLKSLVTSAS
ncbi:MAG: ferrochelatase [Mariprofundales bacterium]|nr:ferrochelatase [Mariprofundales bacterium]